MPLFNSCAACQASLRHQRAIKTELLTAAAAAEKTGVSVGWTDGIWHDRLINAWAPARIFRNTSHGGNAAMKRRERVNRWGTDGWRCRKCSQAGVRGRVWERHDLGGELEKRSKVKVVFARQNQKKWRPQVSFIHLCVSESEKKTFRILWDSSEAANTVSHTHTELQTHTWASLSSLTGETWRSNRVGLSVWLKEERPRRRCGSTTALTST